jgi:glycosyltransferase involved in cell wall biosynthesis
VRVVLLGTGVHPIPPTGYGGVERTLAEFATALGRAGAEVEIVQEPGHGRSRDEYTFARHLGDRFRDLSYDVLHASTPVVARALQRMRRPYVYTTHSRHWFERHGLTQRWGFWLEQRAVRRSVTTIALTAELRRQIVARLGPQPPEALPVIPIGVDTDRFRPAEAPVAPDLALGVGLIAPFKRWEVAIDALHGTGVRLRIAGPITDRSYAQDLQRRDPSLELLGELSEADLLAAYRASAIFVHPSRVELLPGVVLQAYACGLPVLGAAPIRSLVREGVTGWATGPDVLAPRIAPQWNAHVLRWRTDPELRHQLAQNARAEAVERYTWANVAAQHFALYQRLIDRGAFNPGRSPGR